MDKQSDKPEDLPMKVRIQKRREARDKKIRKLYFIDRWSMDEICVKEGHSKTTVFFAIKGRSSNKIKNNNNNKN